jgi:hypothetical protein
MVRKATLPAASVATTSKACTPSARPVNRTGKAVAITAWSACRMTRRLAPGSTLAAAPSR